MAVSNKSLYDKPLSKISLSYYFLKDKKKITLSQSEETVEEITNKISDIAKKIKKGDFKANVGYHCKMCEFNNICEAYQKNSN
jgi:CRISPR/Cas system-associated exonuclease Cas4 (RecB family)